MNKYSIFLIIAICISFNAFGQEANDFEKFGGKYQGTQIISSNGQVIAGAVTANFKVSKSKKKATLTFAGNASILPLGSILYFKRQTVLTTDVSYGLSRDKMLGFGSYSLKRGKKISFNIIAPNQANMFGTFAVKPKGKTKHKLIAMFTIDAPTGAIVFNLQLSGKVKQN